MQLTIDVQGQRQLSRNLRVFADELQNLWEFYSAAIDIVKKRSDDIFASKGSNVEKWPKRKPHAASTTTARDRRWWYYKQSPNKPSLLRWTGRLQEDTTTTINDRFGSFEYNAPYAVYHQDWWKNLPKRPIIDLSNETNTLITKALQAKIQKDIGIFGLQS